MHRTPEKRTQRGPEAIFRRHIAEGRIDAQDGAEVLEYIKEQTALRKWKPGSVERQYSSISSIVRELHSRGKRLEDMSKRDVVDLITFLQNHPTWSEATRPDNWDRFVLFYIWAYKKHGKKWDLEAYEMLAGEDRYKYRIDQNKVQPKSIFTPAEVLELVNAEPDTGYKALWICGFEGGLRIGEAMGLRLRDVQRNNDGTFTLHLPKSKTQKRSIPLELYSPAILAKWLALHPLKGNENSPLFINEMQKSIGYQGVDKRLKLLTQTAGFAQKDKVCFHSLRHSRATELATMMTEQQLCVFFGWKIGSDMPRVYVRAGAIDIRQALRRGYGIEKVEETREHGKKCHQCQHLNAYSADYCDNCRWPLDPSRFQETKKGLDALHMRDVIKEYLRQEIAAELQQLRKEYHAPIQSPRQDAR